MSDRLRELVSGDVARWAQAVALCEKRIAEAYTPLELEMLLRERDIYVKREKTARKFLAALDSDKKP